MRHIPTLLSVGLCLLMARACMADAQDSDLDAGRCLVAETDARQPDLDANAHVILRRARWHHRSASAEARSYCAMYVTHHRSERQRAIATILPTDSTQRGGQMRLALKALREVRLGLRADPCAAAATDWGDRLADAARAMAAGWIQVDCGQTRDLYWIAVRRVRR